MLSPGDADIWVEEDRQTYGEPRRTRLRAARTAAGPNLRHSSSSGSKNARGTDRPYVTSHAYQAKPGHHFPGCHCNS